MALLFFGAVTSGLLLLLLLLLPEISSCTLRLWLLLASLSIEMGGKGEYFFEGWILWGQGGVWDLMEFFFWGSDIYSFFWGWGESVYLKNKFSILENANFWKYMDKWRLAFFKWWICRTIEIANYCISKDGRCVLFLLDKWSMDPTNRWSTVQRPWLEEEQFSLLSNTRTLCTQAFQYSSKAVGCVCVCVCVCACVCVSVCVCVVRGVASFYHPGVYAALILGSRRQNSWSWIE